MRILITGVAGFVGSNLAEFIVNNWENIIVFGIDNLSRRGSEINLARLKSIGCKFIHGDVRIADDVASLPKVDWIIDCAANPSVLAGVGGGAAQVVGHNLVGTLNLLEKCRRDGCGFMLLSTSRVYSIEAQYKIPLQEAGSRFSPDASQPFPVGFSRDGLNEEFSTTPPLSFYGATKLASEVMALEYANAYDFPIWINRCGVIAGAGQFGKIDQGIFSFWIYQWILGNPLAYIGFGGKGKQVRDCLSPEDLGRLVCRQLAQPDRDAPKIINVGGGEERAMSLCELSHFCSERLGIKREIKSVPETRMFDVPYYVTDTRRVRQVWDWQPKVRATEILNEIADWAYMNQSIIAAGF